MLFDQIDLIASFPGIDPGAEAGDTAPDDDDLACLLNHGDLVR